MSMTSQITKYLNKETEAAPLAAFRLLFGLLMFISMIRFWYHGWIEKLYINPEFHFKYYGFEWVLVPGHFTYVLFIICGLAALSVAVGFKYRWAIIMFFLTFTYIELMDKTTYLNHYYFISILSFLLIFLPAGCYYSIDSKRNQEETVRFIPRWNIDALKLLLAIVYIYAGLAKLNADWMLNAMPLKIWLPSKYSLPILGNLMQQEWVHYLFSWGGAVYDLTIVFFLLYRKTRIPAFIMVVIFHLLTRILFPIGMFPYVMIVATLIFFDAGFHERLLKIIAAPLASLQTEQKSPLQLSERSLNYKLKLGLIAIFFIVQLLLPLRFLLYPGHLFWTEEGYRFSWRVMLMEKAGSANFKIVDGKTGKRFYVRNRDFLTSFQEKQMATQPDLILEYAHYLGKTFESHGHQNVQVFVDSYVALNGRVSRPFINPEVDLMTKHESFRHKDWILPFK